MHILYDNGREKKNGFIYVASLRSIYLVLAKFSAESLRDLFPEAHITLFVNKDLLLDEIIDLKIFDTIITDIPVHIRSKMWCMANTPYSEKTAYIDADTQIVSEDIEFIFDELNNCDIMWPPVNDYTISSDVLKSIFTNKYEPCLYHGGACLYNSNKNTLKFMMDWFDKYSKQREFSLENWPYENVDYIWKDFDMFTLWRMTNNYEGEYSSDLSYGLMDVRFGSTILTSVSDCPDPVVIQIPRPNYLSIPEVSKYYEENKREIIITKENIGKYN